MLIKKKNFNHAYLQITLRWVQFYIMIVIFIFLDTISNTVLHFILKSSLGFVFGEE